MEKEVFLSQQKKIKEKNLYNIGAAGDPKDDGEGTDFFGTNNNIISITPITYDLTNSKILDFKKFSGSGMTSDSSRLKLISELKKQGIKNNKVLNAMSIVPRHIFVDEAIAGKAYDNTALPIGKSQTISQPMIVATMTEILLEKNPKRVLEIGTGSGYQAAILSLLVKLSFNICSLVFFNISNCFFFCFSHFLYNFNL